jgi:cytochrome P450
MRDTPSVGSLNQTSVEEMAQGFDQWDPGQAVDPYPMLARLRDECPVAHIDRHGGFWLMTRYDHVNAAFRDHATFSSKTVAIPKQAPGTILPVPPLDQDPPEHTRYRQLLLPFFSPKQAARLEPGARQTARGLVAAFSSAPGCEVVRQYSFPMPAVVLAQVLGIDAADYDRFLAWTTAIVHSGGPDPAGAQQANQEIYAYLGDQLDARRTRPRDDLLTFLLSAEFEGSTLTRNEQLGIATLLLIAGIDTTANTLGTAIWYLAGDQAAQARLRADPAALPTAVEEFLRVFTPVSIARLVTQPVDVGGCPMVDGDQVLLSLPSANRDTAQFDRADDVVLDRAPNSHIAFGAGIHRCLGIHLARMELAVGMEEFLAATPAFHLAESPPVTWKAGPIRGPRAIQLRFTK